MFIRQDILCTYFLMSYLKFSSFLRGEASVSIHRYMTQCDWVFEGLNIYCTSCCTCSLINVNSIWTRKFKDKLVLSNWNFKIASEYTILFNSLGSVFLLLYYFFYIYILLLLFFFFFKGIVHPKMKVFICLPTGYPICSLLCFFSRTQTKIFNSDHCSLSVI